ncbi:unnamed protein product [Vitrella brassicaformis CCMP3155]|uniref:WW domain-containing protein n=2 Tax=Vitrella brassicaformis TaxID=1169539 RepID=A0A0G4H5R7_VITBC|nr:unnamed protein product [Vitrella brassicaformis CCMP3155]|eukprot:CEM39182.1 unnamed protein product [Vitrella brassicaformis CCMP3155]
MADNTAEIPPKTGLGGKLMMPIADDKGKWEKEDCSGRICIFEMQHTTGTERDADKLSEALSTRAVEVAAAGAMACLFVCPEKMEPFTITPPEDKHADLANLPVATMSHEHGSFLKDHLLKLTADKAKQSPGGVPEEAKDWVESREEFTGRVYYHNTITGANRWAPPYVDSGTDGLLVSVKVDTFFERLQKVLKTEPKGVIVAHQSWRPDVALQDPPANGFDESLLSRVPTLQITYEAGQELKAVSGRGCEPIASMEVQPFGGVYAWGMGTQGQLALSEVERDRSMRTHENAFTGEKNSFCHSPCYVSNLHEQQVVQIQCGGTHTATVTQGGEVFSWGRGDACGAMLGDLAAMQTDGFGNKIGCVDVPIVVDQLENIAKARRIFCGDNQTFIIADMPHPPFSTPS